MGQIEINHTGSGGGVVLSSDGTDLLLGGAIGGGGGASAYTIDTKTDNYTAVAGDLGKLIHFTQIGADKTLTLTAAATLGAGWFCYVRYSAIHSGPSYKIIIDPNGSETIDGQETRTMKAGQTFQILCDGSNFHILSSDESRAFSHNAYYNGVGTYGQPLAQPEASGTYAIALGGAALSSGTGSVALGYDSQSTGSSSLAGPKSTATGQYSVSLGIGSPAGTYSGARGAGSIAIGQGARASTSGSLAIGQYSVSEGSNSSAIGQSLASGSHSFAAGITSNSSSYGATGANSIAMGYQNKASGSKSVAIGASNQATTSFATAIGNSNYATHYASISMGSGNTAYAGYGICMGASNSVNADRGFASGQSAKARTKGQFARASGGQGSAGEMQTSWFTLNCRTTDATTKIMGAENGSNGSQSIDQVFLVDDAALSFIGTIVACGPDGTKTGSWEIKGHLKNAAGTTTLPASIVNTIYNPHNWTVALTAHDAHNSLRVSVTGEASLEVWWSAQILSSEVVNN